MSFGTQRAVTHGTGGEARDDAAGRLHLFQREGRAVTGEVHEVSQADRRCLLSRVLEEAVRTLGQRFEGVLGVGKSIDRFHQNFV